MRHLNLRSVKTDDFTGNDNAVVGKKPLVILKQCYCQGLSAT